MYNSSYLFFTKKWNTITTTTTTTTTTATASSAAKAKAAAMNITTTKPPQQRQHQWKQPTIITKSATANNVRACFILNVLYTIFHASICILTTYLPGKFIATTVVYLWRYTMCCMCKNETTFGLQMFGLTPSVKLWLLSTA